MNALLRDLTYGVRLMAKHRGFTAVVVITLGLAIGANTVIFSFANILLLRPLPVRDPDTLGWVFNVGPQAEGTRSRSSVPDFLDLRQAAHSFSALAARREGAFTLAGRGEPERLSAMIATANLPEVWGLSMRLGRAFQVGDDTPGAPPVVLLSNQLWQRRFAADPAIVGRTIALDGVDHVVVGVLDPAIEIGNLSTIDIWTPLVIDASRAGRDDRRLRITGRLAPGVTVEMASAEVQAIAQRLQREYPTTNNGWGARVATTREAMTGTNTWMVLSLLGLVVLFVLLIACANLVNLMLARATGREREIAVRTALGAGRGALARQLLLESTVLGALGGALGLLLAYGGLVAIKAVAYEEIFALLSVDRNVLGFVTGATLFTTFAFGLVPALRTSRADVAQMLRAGSGKTTDGARLRRGSAILVVSQVALAMSLTVVSLLVVRSMIATTNIDVGFDRRSLFGFRVDAPAARYPDSLRLPLLYGRAITELQSLRGVEAAAIAARFPVLGGESPAPVTVEGHVVSRPMDQPWAARSSVSERYFEVTRIPLITGRTFAAADNMEAPPVAIVNREMATRYWGSPAAALGKRVAVGGSRAVSTWLTVVGVAGDTRPPNYTQPASPQLYVSIAQQPTRTMAFLVRSPNAASFGADVRAAMRRVDDQLALYDAGTMEQAFAIEASSTVLLTGMFATFAAIALCLAAAGLYGVISYSVSRRTREIGIRVALGATAGEVKGMIVRQAGRLLLPGIVIGVAAGALIAAGMRSLLYGVTALDPGTYASVIALIALVMGIATLIPARRATRVDPISALRAE